MGSVLIDTDMPARNAKLGLSDRVNNLNIEAACWCSSQRTFRSFPNRGLDELGARQTPRRYGRADAAKLVKAGLWEVAADGWTIVDPMIVVDPDDQVVVPDFRP